MTKTPPCGAPEARFRLEQARLHLSQAQSGAVARQGTAWTNVVASNATLAGVAAADAICCDRSGRRSAGESHDAAVELLRSVLPADRRDLATVFRRLLSVKTPAQYGGKPLAVSKAVAAVRQAEQLVEVAEVLLA